MPDRLELLFDRLDTPVGELFLAADRNGALRVVDWTEHEDRMRLLLQRHYGADVTLTAARDPGGLSARLAAYFAGDLRSIDGLAVETAGSAFQRRVWSALRDVPCGTTVSYGEIARRIGQPSAVRAVGLANGANPVGVVVPCHRVIGSDGSLTGYGGGIARKRWLLRHEGAGEAAVAALDLFSSGAAHRNECRTA